MASTNTPLNNFSNQKENLINPQQQNNLQSMDVNTFFVEKEENKSLDNKYTLTFLFYRISVPFLLIIILCGSIIPVSLIKKVKLYIKLLSIISGVIVSFILLIFSFNKLEIIKDKSNNKIIIKVINFLCFPIKILKIDSENFHFYFKKIIKQDSEGGSHESILFTIINDYKNLVDIDLDTSNIKQKPAKFYYTFDNVRNIRNAERRYTSDLNNFLGISDNYSNPLFFNLYNYIKKIKNTNKFFLPGDLSKYMKFSEHLFTYHFNSPSNNSCVDFVIFSIGVALNLIAISLVFSLLFILEKPFKYFGIYSFVILNIILYITYHCLKIRYEKIYRIDCIFSRNFDRIFIGLVKYNKKSYVNTFEFQMNNIDKFILEKQNYENYNLIAKFKNNEKQLICNIKKTQEELKGLAYLLNERLNKNNDELNTIYN